jgi:hypothetical protein
MHVQLIDLTMVPRIHNGEMGVYPIDCVKEVYIHRE